MHKISQGITSTLKLPVNFYIDEKWIVVMFIGKGRMYYVAM